jgi:hypothetical protein
MRVPPRPPPRFSPSLAPPPGPRPTSRAADGPMVRNFASVPRRKSKATLRHSSGPSRIATSFDRSPDKAETMGPIGEEMRQRNGTPLANTTMRHRFKPGQKSFQQASEASSTEPKREDEGKDPNTGAENKDKNIVLAALRPSCHLGVLPRSRPELV